MPWFSALLGLSVCFGLLHFLSEEISAFLRMFSCPAILMLYQKLAQARTGFQEMETINSMTFQAAHRSAKYRSIGSAKLAKEASLVPGCVFLRYLSLCLWYRLFANILGTCLLMQSLGIKSLQPLSLPPIHFTYFKAELSYNEYIPCSVFLNKHTQTTPCRYLSLVFDGMPCHWHAAFVQALCTLSSCITLCLPMTK